MEDSSRRDQRSDAAHRRRIPVRPRWIALGAVALVAVLLVGGFVGAYNDLVRRSETVESQASQVEVAYQRAFRLVPQLTKLAEDYLSQEVNVMENVTAMRSGLVKAENGTLQQKDAFLQDVVDFVALVGNRAEAYPELKSAELYRDTMAEITNSENKIAMEKVRYNDRVRDYNARLRSCCLPLLAASLFGFRPAEYVGVDNPASRAL